jgi:hypothetical protein
VVDPRRPAPRPARSRGAGGQRHAMRMRDDASGRARAEDLVVLEQDEGARQGGGTPEGGYDRGGARPAICHGGEHVFVSYARTRTEHVFVQAGLQRRLGARRGRLSGGRRRATTRPRSWSGRGRRRRR